MINKASLIESLETKVTGLEKDLMILAIALKKAHRAAKINHRPFYCIAVDLKETNLTILDTKTKTVVKTTKYFPNEPTKALNEFNYILEEIKRHLAKQKFAVSRRMQILVKQLEHWAVVDLQIDAEQNISAFILDAAGDPRYVNIIDSIRKSFHKATIYTCAAKIQKDTYNCGYFSLYHAIKLSDIENLHENLHLNRASHLNFEGYFSEHGKVYAVKSDMLYPTLFAPAQSRKEMEFYLALHSDYASIQVKRQLALADIISAFTTVEFPLGVARENANPLIVDFRYKYQAALKNFILENSEKNLANFLLGNLPKFINEIVLYKTDPVYKRKISQ